ncbi:sugar phosphate isomerase/epimerase family protein [Roseibium sp.]|uniref:sugar phosphate isomerase/epimerase family protein n=1 Tax=Roseibium sp. TaxID=1936156 RepID=UPI003A9735DD
MSHIPSLSFLTLHDVAPTAAIQAAAEAGFQKLGLRLLPANPQAEAPYPLLTDDTLLRETLSVLSDTGLQVADIEMVRLNATTTRDDYAALLVRAAALSAGNILVVGDDTDEVRLTEKYAEFAEVAAGYKINAALEFMPFTGVPDLATAQRIVDAVNTPNATIIIDALHVHRSGTTCDEIAALPVHQIAYGQLCDGPVPFDPSREELTRIARTSRNFPGEGGIDLMELVKALPEDLLISVEVPDVEFARTASPVERAKRAFETATSTLAKAGHAWA